MYIIFIQTGTKEEDSTQEEGRHQEEASNKEEGCTQEEDYQEEDHQEEIKCLCRGVSCMRRLLVDTASSSSFDHHQ